MEALAYLSPDQLTVMEEAQRPDGTYAALQAVKKPRIRQLVVDALPVINPATQTIDRGPYVIGAGIGPVRITWVVRAKTAAELDIDNVEANRATLKAAIALFDAGTANAAQVQRAIAWLLRQAR